MKNYLFILILLVHCKCTSQGQSKNENHKVKLSLGFINNKTIKQSIVMRSCDTCFPISNIGFRFTVLLTEDEERIIRKLEKKQWIKLLENDSSDWAANIILYYLYDKDAALFISRDNRSLWLLGLKNKDIEYWKKHL